ncbi:hypothetical protein F4819DRAFT_46553 [Hypoxylon fuscum]|nr:hypothetical protein F4819DRAFT_46553 [Hypoxylon fuscum]
MATPAQLEEGYELSDIQGGARNNQEPSSVPTQNNSTPRNNDVHQPSVPAHGTSSEDGLGNGNLLRDSQIKNAAPEGWPSIAAYRMYYPNFCIHRRFSYLMQRVIMDQETKLACLENKLQELDREDATINVSRLRSLPFDPDRLLTAYTRTRPQPTPNQAHRPTSSRNGEQNEQRDEYIQWKDKDLILESMLPRLKSYHELLQLEKEMQKLPRISRREHMIFYDRIRKHNVLDELACQFLFPIDDFISTTDRVPQYFEGLLYRDTPIISRIKRIIGQTQDSNTQGRRPGIEIDKRFFVITIKILVASTSGMLLLSPVAILFLLDLSREQSFGVVVSFLFLFVAVMSSLNTNWDTILVGLSAYTAVLVTFLSNLEQGRG